MFWVPPPFWVTLLSFIDDVNYNLSLLLKPQEARSLWSQGEHPKLIAVVINCCPPRMHFTSSPPLGAVNHWRSPFTACVFLPIIKSLQQRLLLLRKGWALRTGFEDVFFFKGWQILSVVFPSHLGRATRKVWRWSFYILLGVLLTYT